LLARDSDRALGITDFEYQIVEATQRRLGDGADVGVIVDDEDRLRPQP